MIRDLSAAAARYTQRSTGRSRGPNNGWQDRAWTFYDEVPEVRFAATWIGNAMSGARLYAGRRTDTDTIEEAPAGHLAADLVRTIAGGPDGQSQMLGDFGPHLTVAGEGWIVVVPHEYGDDWRVLSSSEVRQQSGKLTAEIDGAAIDIPPADADGSLAPDAPAAIRVWEPHPRRHLDADSPVRSALDLLEELQLLNASVKAIARSRLTGRGVLLVPKGVRFPTAPGTSDAEDDLIDVFMQVAETAYREPESAAATVPIILEVPAEAIGDIKRLTFESDFDDIAMRLREEAIRRFATGLEVPAEILLGQGGVNHWGAWALQEEAIRLGVEPRLATVAHALTTQWLRPLLDDAGIPDAEQWLVWYDTSPLRVRANRSQTALEVYDRGAISAEALRRETGFDESDAATSLPGPPAASDNPEGDAPVTRATPRLPADETTSEPATLPAAATISEGLLAAVDGLVWAALYAAGEKLKRTPACPRSLRARAKEIVPAELHTELAVDRDQVEQWRLLDGAWARVPEIAARYALDPACLTAALDDYARELIAAGVAHAYEQTAAALRSPCIGLAA